MPTGRTTPPAFPFDRQDSEIRRLVLDALNGDCQEASRHAEARATDERVPGRHQARPLAAA